MAGAWIAPENVQTIWTEVAGQRDEVFYSESSYYVEAPVGERVSIVASPWVAQDQWDESGDGLRWEVTLAAKTAVWRTADAAMAVQAGATWLSDPAAACEEAGAELRWLGGVTFGRADRGFVNIEAAERVSAHDCGGARADLTVGYRAAENWLAMAQVFVDDPRLGESAIKAQMRVVRFGEDGRGLQIGLRARLDGDSAEPALVLGFWGSGR